MKTKPMTVRLAALALIALGGSAITVACSSSSNNPSPTTTVDSGPDSTKGTSSGTKSDGGTSSGSSGTDGSIESGCSDASNCNSCTTVATDPYNACTAAVANCVKFPYTVPPHPTL